MEKIINLDNQTNLYKHLANETVQRRLHKHINFFNFVDDYVANEFFQNLNNEILSKKTSTLDILTDFTDTNYIGSYNEFKYKLIDFLQPVCNLALNDISKISITGGFQSTYKQSSENKLLGANKNDLVIIVKYWEYLSESSRSVLIQLLNNLNAYEKKYNKKFYIFINSTSFSTTMENLTKRDYSETYNFEKLSFEESKKILLKNLNKQIEESELKNLYSLLDGKITDIITLINSNSKDKTDIEGLLNNIIEDINKKIKDSSMTNYSYLQLLSIMPDYFNPYQLCLIDRNIKNTDIDELISILKGVSMLFSVDDFYYTLFSELRAKLLKMHKSKSEMLHREYYKYLDYKYPDDYFKKLNVIIECTCDQQRIMAIYYLAFENSLRGENKIDCEEIKRRYQIQTNQKNAELFSLICDSLSDNISESLFNILLQKGYSIEDPLLKSAILKNDILNLSKLYKPGDELESLCYQLYHIIEENKKTKTEIFHYIICSFVLLPNILDKFNDRNTFEKLKTMISDFSNSSETLKSSLKYYDNIMLRKSFYQCNINMAKQNYNLALNYFKTIGDVREQYMTLNGLIGINIVLGDINEANRLYNEIINLKNNHNREYLFPQFYKTHNNKILLDYFTSITKKPNEINELISRFENLLPKCNNVAYNVVCTNICSLSLLIDDFQKYEQYKLIFEEYNNIQDVSDISDTSIDDFYRYYFLWFEFGKNIITKNMERAKDIYIMIDNFIPEIFITEQPMLKQKYKYYKEVFDKNINNGQQFCDFIKNKRNNYVGWEFYSRGFMLSDLQHTSIF